MDVKKEITIEKSKVQKGLEESTMPFMSSQRQTKLNDLCFRNPNSGGDARRQARELRMKVGPGVTSGEGVGEGLQSRKSKRGLLRHRNALYPNPGGGTSRFHLLSYRRRRCPHL